MLTLNTEITKINRVGLATAKKLARLGIMTIEDLLYYYPFRYDDFSSITEIDKLQAGVSANVVGQIELIQNRRSPRKRMNITEALVNDGTETLKVIWFNQPFIARNLKVGDGVSLAGRVTDDYGAMVMMSPVYEKIQRGLTRTYADLRGIAVHTQGLVPNYHLTANITQKQIRYLIKQIMGITKQISDWLPFEIRKNLKFLDLAQAINKIHFPKSKIDIAKARERLAFNELFLIQLQAELIRRDALQFVSTPIKFFEKETKELVASLPFKLTDAQRKAAWEIVRDIAKERPMARLLEGDVGSGKTIVAILAMYNVALNRKQAVLMVPTEILARQHFDTVSKLLKDFNVKVGLVTRSQIQTNADLCGLMRTYADKAGGKITKNNILELIKKGKLQIIIGTHSLIQEGVYFKNLALVVIDEQHRFGVQQRAALATRTNADQRGPTRTDDGHDGLLYEDLTYKIRGAIFNVKKELGLGHKEKIYQNALGQEFKKIGISFSKEMSIEVRYDDKKIGTYRPDFIIEDKIVLEIKKLPFIGKFEKEQVWHYLRGSKYKLAILVNFAQDDVHIERFIDSHKKVSDSPFKSALVRMSPHLLSMTATPIPRSLALALYGDLDLSVINEMPKGRKTVITKVVPEAERQQAYKFVREQVKQSRQVFVICPLIDPSDKLGVKSVRLEYEKLDKEVFPELVMGMLHGRMKSKEKEKIMQNFLDNKIKILVSTSVVEVGVDVPNATIMLIEGADRFGLAQLHQFRGRVGRSDHQSYCFLFTDSQVDKTIKRLEALVSCHNGFELAKMDLKFRGPGEIYGTEQKGFPELKVASLFDYQLMKLAQGEAVKLIAKDPSLNSWPGLKNKLGQWESEVHLE